MRSLAKAVLAAELKTGAEVLMPLVDLALAHVRPDEAPVLLAHPETLAALAAQLPAGLATAPDAAMARDEFAVHGPDFAIAAGLDARLAQALEALL